MQEASALEKVFLTGKNGVKYEFSGSWGRKWETVIVENAKNIFELVHHWTKKDK